MQLLHAANFSAGQPKTVGEFMNFIDKPEERPMTAAEVEQELKGIFGV